MLDQVLDSAFIDAQNQSYDFDITKEWTWEFRDLVEIKKRKRYVTKIYRPTLQAMLRKESAVKFHKAQEDGSLITKAKPFPNYQLYRYFPDKYAEDK